MLALIVSASPVLAAPRSPEAKAAFDRGVAAYTKDDFQAASEALATSFALEADIETLFAWAQTERKLERCDKAIELYEMLIKYDMPAENRAAVQTKLEECKVVIASTQPVTPTPTPLMPTPTPTPTAMPVAPPAEGARAWWKDPVGGALVGAGVVGLAVGSGLLISARGADRDKASASTYGEFQTLESRAESRGRLGMVSTVLGAGLIVGGVAWYVTRPRTTTETAVTGWLSPDGGGVVAAGRF